VNRDYIPIKTKGGNEIELPVDKRLGYGHTEDGNAYLNPGLKSPETWENRLSAGEDKKTVFEDLMANRKLFGLAFLRNLRNMEQAGVAKRTVAEYAANVNISRILPFRFIAAARVLPQWEDVIEPMMLRACEGRPKLRGHTVVLLDVSGSMNEKISAKSDIRRLDAAMGVAILLREVCEEISIVTFSTNVVAVPPRRGFALAEAIDKSQYHGNTYLGAAVATINPMQHDRLIVLTDEQSHDPVGKPKARLPYMINVASHQNGVGYGDWNRIDGWSEAVIDYIEVAERSTM